SFLLTAETVWRSIDPVIRAQGRPLLGHDMIAQYHAYRLARENGIVVVLDGQGADELLAGLPHYEAQMFPEMLRRGQIFRLAREIQIRSQKYDSSLASTLGTYVWNPIRRRIKDACRSPRYSWIAPAETDGDSTQFGPGKNRDRGRDPSMLNR